MIFLRTIFCVVALQKLVVCTFIILTVLHILVSSYERCIPLSDSPTWQRRFNINNKSHPIIVEVTQRASHRIVSRILTILLRERLNYLNVEEQFHDWDDPTKSVDRLSTPTTSSSSNSKSTINLEVWMPPGFNVEMWVNRGEVIDCGPLGPISRLGLFAHSSFINGAAQLYNVNFDHWRTMASKTMRSLLLWPSWLPSSQFSPNSSTQSNSTKIITCLQIAKFIDNCDHSSRNDCLPLIVDTIHTGLIKHLVNISIELFHDNVFTFYLANASCIRLVGQLMNNSTTMDNWLFLLNWFPNDVTVQQAYNRVSFPDCYDHQEDSDLTPVCRFQINQLTKVVSVHLPRYAISAHKLVDNIRFTQSEMETMLMKVPLTEEDRDLDDVTLQQIACEWLTQNRGRWLSWTKGFDEKESLVIGGIFALYGKWSLPDFDKAAKIAIEKMNSGLLLNTPYELQLVVRNSTCDEALILQDFVHLTSLPCAKPSQPVGIIAAVCSDSVVAMAKLSNLQRRLVISPTVESNKVHFDFFFRTIPSMELYVNLLVDVFSVWKWKRIVLMRKDSIFIDSKQFKDQSITVVDDFDDSEGSLRMENINKFLRAINEKYGRIFVLEYYAQETCQVLCAAFRMNMTMERGYVWFVNAWLDHNWWLSCSQSCSQKEMISMVRGVFILKHDLTDVVALDGNGHWEPNAFYYSYTADAVEVLGQAVYQLLIDNPAALSAFLSESVSTKLLSITKNINTTPSSSSSSQRSQRNGLTFDKRNTRTAHRWLLQQLQSISSSNNSLEFKTIIKWIFPPHWNEDSVGVNGEDALPKQKWENSVIWYKNGTNTNKIPPTDGSEYLLQSHCHLLEPLRQVLNTSCEMTIIIINLMIILPLLVIVIVLIIYCDYRLRRAAQMADQKPFDDLCHELNELSISPSHVRINVPLGHGAFGMVLGGEACLQSRWITVAVKRLNTKDCSSFEEKVNFLKEAKIMKDLQHENIVKLLAVCFQDLSLVMEFMLLSDLKSYLLQRRPQAREPNNPQVQSATLTRFARQIASGLEYLHENNIIHRDIACRNCLVNADYTVKIGDFGLARPLYEVGDKGYYRLCKVFDVPVRWMPPEAITYGVFSPQSDIWSFGIVLYEIVTFGVFPFMDYNDYELIEQMKKPHFSIDLIIPTECRGQPICELMQWCCQRDKDLRPVCLSQIINFLETHPCCVAPYLTADPPQFAKPFKVAKPCLPPAAGASTPPLCMKDVRLGFRTPRVSRVQRTLWNDDRITKSASEGQDLSLLTNEVPPSRPFIDLPQSASCARYIRY